MVFILIFALISTLFYINMLIVEMFNNKQIPNKVDDKDATTNAFIRFILIILIGIFWGITIRFW